MFIDCFQRHIIEIKYLNKWICVEVINFIFESKEDK